MGSLSQQPNGEPMSSNTPNPIASFKNGVMNSGDVSPLSWDSVYDVVDYPVIIEPLFVERKEQDGSLAYLPAVGDTNTGRGTEFFGVSVDRNRTGELSTIAVVTGTYGTLPTKDVYRDLRKDLAESDLIALPERVYVSGNGGRCILTLSVTENLSMVNHDDFQMIIHLDTSVDGSKKHNIRLSVYDVKNRSELVGLTEQRFSVGTKHTRTIDDRHVAFKTVLVKLASEWNSTIVPFMTLMDQTKIDKSMALDILRDIMENSDIPEKHIVAASTSYDAAEDTVLSVVRGISTYLEKSLSDKPERLESFRERLNKIARAAIQKTIKKLENN